ncbi:glycosyltransferase family 1 protein [Jannaschia sp. W003]|uniref:glycosyltransferase family 1 protein n=1 Tax=Jannaschia sp. W003 TaxID=2867012 RepID=UPI0021A8C7AB|nr:glycosyltransferase family 1 protein [Jannaschia sp. W003]UWQ21560.1 glycosyltransferase family 1 protein [Jannaschia sp. W003]
MATAHPGAVDVLVVADLRFTGGTSAALAADVRAFSALGLSVALMPVRSAFLDDEQGGIAAVLVPLLDLAGVALVPDGRPAPPAETAFLHNPMTFAAPPRGARPIAADRTVLVAHHPPFRGDGSLEYNPAGVALQVRRAFGAWPRWAPVSGLIRAQLRAFAPLIALTADDWHNVFDPEAWRARRPAFSGTGGEVAAVVGRHGRADRLKWPATAADVTAPLAPGPGWRARVMGAAPEAIALAGPAADAWEVLPFGTLSPRCFLEGLDAFVYHHHPDWVEAFGRTVAEAILMERPCLLDPKLAPTFGDLADYAAPADAPARLNAWLAAPAAARAEAAERRARAVTRFGDASVAGRLARLRDDGGTRARGGPKAASAAVTARKAVGLARRQWARGRSWAG